MAKAKKEIVEMGTEIVDDVVEDVVEEIDVEEALKKRYMIYCESHKVDIERTVDSAAGSFSSMSNEVLLATAKNYKKSPFNQVPATVNALAFEMNKRGLELESTELIEMMRTVDWFNKPWILMK